MPSEWTRGTGAGGWVWRHHGHGGRPDPTALDHRHCQRAENTEGASYVLDVGIIPDDEPQREIRLRQIRIAIYHEVIVTSKDRKSPHHQMNL